jgi:hypothetical protein
MYIQYIVMLYASQGVCNVCSVYVRVSRWGSSVSVVDRYGRKDSGSYPGGGNKSFSSAEVPDRPGTYQPPNLIGTGVLFEMQSNRARFFPLFSI